ncbi:MULTISPECIES: pyridoxamine 5'-phosphate oxidase family protein [Achromobacter]|uniref:Pyridoxamine 5'-phosphate oxidase family protein n=1 Tax=Achromobacter spanius TaxID=217203 RepID=A0ABY8GUJ4_9BURK|nr:MULTISPECIES: pyridoxamine 5'-phosphate oxidase family protein [Achromobacter]WAI82213.1 pyridoxamine 5'-phosphate oxidase family protein [Achromobacter spanius]WEX92301.1 pyridoxamine 5'-phosphate oxidase family protein [Achromobacter sp. SS2-2022]WFP08549.1 pyridoxamine 5'-phosphate oxidase family protein [Achromobacter spanius]
MTNADATPHNASPWHEGERLLQTRIGVAERMAQIGPKVIRDYMPDQHRAFFAQLPFVVMGTVDPQGDPWAGVLEGEPGFAISPDPHTLSVAAAPDADDPLRAGLGLGQSVGLLGIELHTRRRNRMNGHIAAWDGQRFDVAVTQSFGNCPQYIQARDFSFSRPPSLRVATAQAETSQLDDAARALIRASDTFFVASYVDAPDVGSRAVDVSHRGGKPGFVRVDGNVLTIPDFSGNRFFNTLGNLTANPRAGLVFIDFEQGDVLQVSGRAEVVLDSPEIQTFAGAERLWRVHVRRVVRRPGALALRWRFHDYAPTALATGQWPA